VNSAVTAKPTKEVSRKRARTEMRPEYDFSGGVRGKYAARYRRGTSVVLLEPEAKKRKPKARSH